MHVVNVSDLPAGEGSRSRSLEGAEAGGVDLSIIFVDLDVGPGDVSVVPAGVPHRFESSGDVPLRQLSLHLAPEMVTEWLEGER